VAAGLDGAHHDFAGVDADADVDAGEAPFPKVLAAAAKILTRREGGMNRALRMVLVCDWCAEHREDPIAGRLHDVAVIAMDRVDHQLHCGIDNRTRFFGIEVRHQLGRALDVSEQRRDGFALTVDCFGC
jgi:hypothetical protein